MVRDHFRPFLIGKKRPSRFGGFGADAGKKSNVKTHLMWLIVASGASVAAWKVSKWHSSYEEMQKAD